MVYYASPDVNPIRAAPGYAPYMAPNLWMDPLFVHGNNGFLRYRYNWKAKNEEMYNSNRFCKDHDGDIADRSDRVAIGCTNINSGLAAGDFWKGKHNMFKGILNNRYAAIAVLAIMTLMAGCSEQMKDTSYQNLDQQRKAVSLYVDATMLNEINDREKAIQKLDEAIQLDPEFTLAFSLKGDIYQAGEQFDESATAYEAATVLDPWSFKDFFNLGKVTQVMQQFTRSIRAYVTACELEPRHYQSHMNVARCYYQVEDFQKAMEYGTKAKQLEPTAADPDLLFGDIFEAKEDHDNAVVAYRRALELEGNTPRIMVPLAVTYLRTERYEAGKELLNSAIKIDPENEMAYQYLGWVQLKLKEHDKAIASYEKAVSIAPGDWAVKKGLGVAYIFKFVNTNDPALKEKALEQWRKSLEIEPDQPDLRKKYEQYSSQ